MEELIEREFIQYEKLEGKWQVADSKVSDYAKLRHFEMGIKGVNTYVSLYQETEEKIVAALKNKVVSKELYWWIIDCKNFAEEIKKFERCLATSAALPGYSYHNSIKLELFSLSNNLFPGWKHKYVTTWQSVIDDYAERLERIAELELLSNKRAKAANFPIPTKSLSCLAPWYFFHDHIIDKPERLLEQLQSDTNIRDVLGFINRETAETVIEEALERHKDVIKAWTEALLLDSTPKRLLLPRVSFQKTIGHIAKHDSQNLVPATELQLVLGQDLYKNGGYSIKGIYLYPSSKQNYPSMGEEFVEMVNCYFHPNWNREFFRYTQAVEQYLKEFPQEHIKRVHNQVDDLLNHPTSKTQLSHFLSSRAYDSSLPKIHYTVYNNSYSHYLNYIFGLLSQHLNIPILIKEVEQPAPIVPPAPRKRSVLDAVRTLSIPVVIDALIEFPKQARKILFRLLMLGLAIIWLYMVIKAFSLLLHVVGITSVLSSPPAVEVTKLPEQHWLENLPHDDKVA